MMAPQRTSQPGACLPKPFIVCGGTVSYFFFTVSIDQVNKVISNTEDTISSLPRSDPQFPPLFALLGIARVIRYRLSDDEQDLDRSIAQLTHAVFLPLPPSVEGSVNLIQAFFYLAAALFHGSHKFQQLSTLKYSVKYLRYLRDKSFEAFGIEYDSVTTLLVRSLALQVELESGDSGHGMHLQDVVEEMSTLCFELFTSDVDESLLETAIVAFATAVAFFMASSNEISEPTITCLREANKRLPNLHSLSIVLSMSLFTRFYLTKSDDDYKDAMATLDRIIASRSPAENPGKYMREALDQAAAFATFRSNNDGNPEYLEDAISRYRAYLSKIALDDPEYPTVAQALADLEKTRFEEFGTQDGSQQRRPVVDDPPLFSYLTASLAKSSTGKYPLMTLEDRVQHYDAVYSMGGITDITDIGEAAKYCRVLLASLQTSPEDQLTFMTTIKIGDFFILAFKLTHDSEYLNESIAIFRGMVEMPRAHWLHFDIVTGLIWSLSFQFLVSKDRKDLDEIMRLYSIAVTDSYAKISDRFRFSCHWAQYARAHKHPSISTAYEIAASLMQDTLTFAPTLEIQHSRLISMRNEYEKLPLDYASYLVDIGHHEKAIETLEQGRGLFWSEMRGFRTSIDRLRVVDSTLAGKFAAINRELEELTTSVSPDAWRNDLRVEGLSGMDPFSNLVAKQRKLLEDRNNIINEIQALPGFERFLMAPSFDTLRSAAAHGPVIIIVHTKSRSHIIILLRDSPPSLIPTADDFYSRANQMRDKLLDARRKGLDSEEYEDTLKFILAELYDLVGRQVIERLHSLNVPEQSRIWWCPTSVFCSLPLHAMGPIRTDGHHKLYFLDLYIPSYTPTISALIEARNPGATSFQVPAILLVTQPDDKMPNALQEMRVVQAITTSVTSLTRETATPSATLEHLRDHQFLHISCHGELKIGKPFDASFKLNQGTRLTLLDIVRSQLPNAEFAFLSACHSAEITEESIADEGLHLTAAVQYCGYRSVVGTMWAMADIDGPDLSGYFYRSVFSDRWKGIPYHERTAEALLVAVRRLRRKKNITLERWVNFVHYGA